MLSFPVLPHWAKFCRPCGAYACGVSGPWPRRAAPQSAAAEASPLPGVDTLRRAVGESAQVLAARALGLAAPFEAHGKRALEEIRRMPL